MKNIAFLTGAGVSTESGIPDFQTISANWIYETPREEVFSVWFYRDYPEKFWEIYRNTFMWENKEPNDFHNLPKLLSASGRNVDVLTQNVDGLHGKSLSFIEGRQLAKDGYTLLPAEENPIKDLGKYGELSVWEAHGNASEVICVGCREVSELSSLLAEAPKCEKCDKFFKPNISLFGEGISHYGEGRRAIINCDVLIVAGTSLDVGPVNELPLYMESHNMVAKARSIWVNKTPPPDSYNFDEMYLGSVSEFAKDFVNTLS